MAVPGRCLRSHRRLLPIRLEKVRHSGRHRALSLTQGGQDRKSSRALRKNWKLIYKKKKVEGFA